MFSIHITCSSSSCPPGLPRGKTTPRGRQCLSVGSAAAGTQASSSVCLSSSALAYHIPPVVIDAELEMLITFLRSPSSLAQCFIQRPPQEGLWQKCLPCRHVQWRSNYGRWKEILCLETWYCVQHTTWKHATQSEQRKTYFLFLTSSE